MYRGCTVYECFSCPYVFEINDTTDFVSSASYFDIILNVIYPYELDIKDTTIFVSPAVAIYLCEIQINDTTKSLDSKLLQNSNRHSLNWILRD